MSVNEKFNAWLHCPVMPDELRSQLQSMDHDLRHDSFYRNLAFGTGGLRGVLGAGTNRMNVFTVMKATEADECLFVMRNPWGNEPAGSTANNRTDGKLKIPNEHEKLRLIDFRLVYPGPQMAEYKKEDLGGYTPPRFNAKYTDMNPTDEMLRMYNVKNYVPVFPLEDDVLNEQLEGTED